MSIDFNQYNSKNIPTWCIGCGNFGIHMALKKALSELNIQPSETFISFDIGCNGNGADKINTYAFKGLHGRAIALAIGAHLANRRFTVIADIGDGGCFHEGLDHLIHCIRSNYDITVILHNNENFALTTGQATVSTAENKPMYGLPEGKPERSIDISKFILNQNPSFFARAYSGDPMQLSQLIQKGIQNKGCSIIEVMQLCPSYNEELNHEWFAKRIAKTESLGNYSPNSLEKAMELISTNKEEKIYTGVLFQNIEMKTFYDNVKSRENISTELVDEVHNHEITKLLNLFK